MGDQRHKRQYPEGPTYQMTPEWKDAVRAKLAELGKSQAWLAAQVSALVGGCDRSGISVMLHPRTAGSKFVRAVSDVLLIPMPVIGITPEDADLVTLVSQLDDDDRSTAIAFIRRLLR